MQQSILKHQLKELGQKLLAKKLKYKKYFRKTSLKQKGHGDFFLDEVRKKKPKFFLEVDQLSFLRVIYYPHHTLITLF